MTYEPEPFLGDEIKPAQGTTSPYGDGSATIAKEDRPDPTTPSGMQLGIYKVKISKKVGDKEMVPAKYNENTILGQEVAPNVRAIANNSVVYALTTKDRRGRRRNSPRCGAYCPSSGDTILSSRRLASQRCVVASISYEIKCTEPSHMAMCIPAAWALPNLP